jgi:hypothetical protein
MKDNKVTKWHRIPVPKFAPLKKKRKLPLTALPLQNAVVPPLPSPAGLVQVLLV